MLDTRFLRGSDGTGNAPIARINTQRLGGATVYKVDTVNKWPTQAFIATVGTLNSNGYLDPALAPINEFRGHISGTDIILDAWEPGSPNATVDAGNAVNQYIILKQTTGWANLVQDSVAELQNEDITRQTQNLIDYVQTGGIWSFTAATLTGAMTAVTAYQAGLRATLAAVASRTFTASRDTYVDLLRGGTTYAPTFSLVYTEVVNGAASPTLAANSIRLAKVVSGTTAITSIDQATPDTLNNPVYPQNLVGKKVTHLRYESAGQGALATGTVMLYANKIYDLKNEWNTSTNKFTVTEPGLYQIINRNWWGSAGAGTTESAEFFVRRNGSNYAQSERMNGSGDAARLIRPIIEIAMYLNIGETIDVLNGCTNNARDVPGGASTYIEIHRIG